MLLVEETPTLQEQIPGQEPFVKSLESKRLFVLLYLLCHGSTSLVEACC